MAISWNTPTVTELRGDVLDQLKARDVDLATMFDGSVSTDIPTNAIRWSSSAKRLEKWDGSTWGELESGDYAMSVTRLAGLLADAAASANTIVKRDASGRIKAAAPAASGDVIRKQELDTHRNATTLDHPSGSVKLVHLHSEVTDAMGGATLGYTPVNKAGDAMTGYLSLKDGGSVASASTISPGLGGNYFTVTGTTGITAINASAPSPLTLRFASALTITHGTNLLLPASKNVSVTSGDIGTFVKETSGKWRLTSYMRFAGGAISGGEGSGIDADKLRGYSDYYRPGDAINATTLNGQSASFYNSPFRNLAVFDTPGATSFTVPAGVTSMFVQGCGGGGRGDSSSVRYGGGGGYFAGFVSVTPGEIISLTIGAGGAASVGAGGSTSFRSTMVANGGNPAGGGSASGGQINIPGSNGSSGDLGGRGGAGVSALGITSQGPGAGGRGGTSPSPGKNGAIYLWY